MNFAFNLLSAVLLGFALGWVCAHAEVAQECEKLKSFYVGETVFACERKKT